MYLIAMFMTNNPIRPLFHLFMHSYCSHPISAI